MTRITRLALAALVASLPAIACAGTPVKQSELPKTILTFLDRHFHGDAVTKAEKDQGRRGTEYEVDLGSGAEIDFRDNGEWKEVKASRGNAVPAAIIPAEISKYVSEKFKGRDIVEISRKRGGYEVELSDGTELRLTEDASPMNARNGGKRPDRR